MGEHRRSSDGQEFYIRRLVENAPVILYVADFPHMRCRFISPALTPMLGFLPQEWIDTKRCWFKQLHDADRDRVMDSFLAAEAEKATHCRLEYRIWHKERTHFIWLDDHCTCEHDPEGRPVLMRGTMIDITRTKETQQTLEVQLDELKRFQAITVDREFRMQELKRENKRLKARISVLEGDPPPENSAE